MNIKLLSLVNSMDTLISAGLAFAAFWVIL